MQLALTAVLAITGNTGDLWRLVQPALLLAGLTAATAVIASIQVGLGRYAGELVVAVMWKRVLRVATRVDLRKFESARFYDRLHRVQANAPTRPYQITYGLVATMGALAASAGLVVAIVLVHPALLPLLLVGGVPILLTSRRQSQLEFDFLARQTQSMRLRTYLTWVQTGRDEAKEIRAFGIARNFGQRLNTLYADYLRDLAQHVSQRSKLGAAGSLGSAALLALTLFLLAWLISTGRLSIAEAGAALVAIRLLAGQVQSGLTGAQAIFESGSFIDDLDGFLTLAPAAEGGSRETAPPATSIAFGPMPSASPIPVAARLPCRPPTSRSTVVRWSPSSARTARARPPWPRSWPACTSLAAVLFVGMAPTYAPSDRTSSGSGSRSSSRTLSGTPFPPRRTLAWRGRTTRSTAINEAAKIADADSFLSSLPAGYQTPLSRRFMEATSSRGSVAEGGDCTGVLSRRAAGDHRRADGCPRCACGVRALLLAARGAARPQCLDHLSPVLHSPHCRPDLRS